MIIKNFSRLASNNIRRDALLIAEAGYESIELSHLFQNKCRLQAGQLCIGENKFNLSKYKNIYIVGIGKGSAKAVKAILKTIPKHQIKAGAVVDIESIRLGKIKSYKGTHPLPSEKNISATKEIIRILELADINDLVLTIICGGGSSLACQPGNNMTCTDLQAVGDYLLKSGADITQINTVRKHLSLIHGGFLAQYAYPSKLISLIISDVPGDKLDMIASGPTVKDTTSMADAKKVAYKYGLKNLKFLETPKDPKYFKKVENIIIANGQTALYAMKTKAIELGYKPKIYSKTLSGMAKNVGPKMAKTVRPGEALLACGETQVHVTHTGKGGRNQDVALSALACLKKNSAIVSAASDGKDNINVAGGITDYSAMFYADKFSIWPQKAVTENQSYISLKKLKGIFKIKKVTANISDFVVVLRKQP
jgi:glycerate-2-kinase